MTSSLTITANLIHQSPEEIIEEINQGFEWFFCQPNQFKTAVDIAIASNINKQSVCVPGTVAMHVQDPETRAKLDEFDHWYLTSFKAVPANYKKWLLQFDGLLTYADVYLNGNLILASRNAFQSHIIDVTQLLKETNQLAICFRAIQPIYSAKHPRARYMTRLVNERHLRFIRTPVLGYTPGFSSATKAVGPYRPIRLIGQNQFTIQSSKVNALLIGNSTGQLDIDLVLIPLAIKLESASLVLIEKNSGNTVCEQALNLIQVDTQTTQINGQVIAENIHAYWPHTHGTPHSYQVKVSIKTDNQNMVLSLGYFGFKKVERSKTNKFSLTYNGLPIFFRGACWTPIDPVTLLVNKISLRERLTLLRDAGINMLRIPGNMLYESDDFYALCDELGIAVFQDFAFTNFDYPETDTFNESVIIEVSQFLSKHGNRPCMTILSGGSEVAQQASMMGLSLASNNHPLFTKVIPDITKKLTPYIPYVASSPYSSQGLPFHAGDGPCSYHGVGGYLRSFEDARAFKGQFISECLPFSNVPDNESLHRLWDGEMPPPHHPLWKEGVPRDPGSGWDFSDTTDYYLNHLFKMNPVELRSIDLPRYLAYCRATVVETIETTMSIFRSKSSTGGAALVWNLHDFKPGAGWGYIDSLGQPKSAFYALARTTQPTTLLFVDEGLEGLAIYLSNDKETTLDGQLSLTLITSEGKVYEQNTIDVTLLGRSLQRMSVDSVIGRFIDSNYAYHFGPRAFIACVAQLHDTHGNCIAHKTYVPPIETNRLINDAGINALASKINNHEYMLTVTSQQPAYFVSIAVEGFLLNNNYFHVMPGFEHQVKMTSINHEAIPQGRLRALNVIASSAISVAQT